MFVRCIKTLNKNPCIRFLHDFIIANFTGSRNFSYVHVLFRCMITQKLLFCSDCLLNLKQYLKAQLCCDMHIKNAQLEIGSCGRILLRPIPRKIITVNKIASSEIIFLVVKSPTQTVNLCKRTILQELIA